MAHKLLDRCKETTSTTGTGTLALTGPVSGFIAMADATNGLTANGDTSWFVAENGTEWEMFLGTRVDSTHLARTTFIRSSTGSPINFTAPPVVFSTIPGEKIMTRGAAFSAGKSSTQVTSAAAYTKITFPTEEFDADGSYDAANSKFLPTVAGYYQITAGVASGSTFTTNNVLNIYKNGALFKAGIQPAVAVYGLTVAGLVYLDGVSDYVEIFTYTSAATTMLGNTTGCYFQGHLAQKA